MDYPTEETTRELRTRTQEETVNSISQMEDVRELIVPVIREELEVHKELRRTGTVRILKTIRELDELVTESLASEAVDVERVPMDLLVEAPPPIRTEGNVTIVPVVKEVLVVTKQLRVVEELRITKRQSISDYRENVTLRAEEVVVERVNPEDLGSETNEQSPS